MGMSDESIRLDELDIKILDFLHRDARMSLRKISERLGVSVATVHYRLEKLRKSGLIKGFSVLIDEKKLGFPITAAILARGRTGKDALKSLEESISTHPHVYAVYDITGDWDVLILGKFRNIKELDNFVKSLLADPRIERTSTSIVLNVVKEHLALAPSLMDLVREEKSEK